MLTAAAQPSVASAASSSYNDMKPGMAEAQTVVYASKPSLWKGTVDTPVVGSCTKVNWMTSTCTYSVHFTPRSGGPKQVCSGSVKVTRHQQMFTYVVPVGGRPVCVAPTLARVYPTGLNLTEAAKATVNAVSTMALPQAGTVGVAVPSCAAVSWMAARCTWSVAVTTGAGKLSTCTGTLSIVKRQVVGYPITATRVARSRLSCTVPA
jgi:hypothetical protein